MVTRKVAEFVESWRGKGDEKQDTQRFWMDLFQKVYLDGTSVQSRTGSRVR